MSDDDLVTRLAEGGYADPGLTEQLCIEAARHIMELEVELANRALSKSTVRNARKAKREADERCSYLAAELAAERELADTLAKKLDFCIGYLTDDGETPDWIIVKLTNGRSTHRARRNPTQESAS